MSGVGTNTSRLLIRSEASLVWNVLDDTSVIGYNDDGCCIIGDGCTSAAVTALFVPPILYPDDAAGDREDAKSSSLLDSVY